MQNAWEQNFDNRMLYYAAEAIMRQDVRIAPNHPWDYTIDPVIGLAICNFTMPRFAHERIAFFNLRDEITGQRYGNQLGLVFVHLPEFSNEVEECVTDLDMIVYSLKNMEEIQKMGRVPFSQGEGDFYSRIATMSRVSALSPDERLEYDRWRKAENDRMLAEQRLVKRTLEEGMAKGIQQGMAKGIQQGMAQGMAKGERKNSLHVANKLIKMGGFTPEQISEISNLSIDEVTQLLNQSN